MRTSGIVGLISRQSLDERVALVVSKTTGPDSMKGFWDDAEMRRKPNNLKVKFGTVLIILAVLTMHYSHAACPSLY